jgi:sulfur carrier protein
MKVIIRNPRRREFELEGSRRVDALLRELDLNPEQVLVVRNDDLLTRDVVVRNDDTVEIVTAISGGIGLGTDGAALGIRGVMGIQGTRIQGTRIQGTRIQETRIQGVQ